MEDQFTYENFDLLVEAGPEGRYRARVLRSPAGESASVQFAAPFLPVELENFVLRMMRPRHGTRGPGRPESGPLKEFGGRLYGAVFQDELRDTLLASLRQTRAQGVGLRLRLRMTDTPELAELPWEFLYDPRLNRFLAQSRYTPLVRYMDLPYPPRPLGVEGPLRLLVMISSPTDYPALDVEQEWNALTGALAEQQAHGRVVVERLNANMGTLRKRLRRDAFHLFHFVGHGHYRSDWGDGVLVMEDRNGRPHEVTGEELGGLLNEYDTTRLVVLNACEGARSGVSDPFAGVAQSLIQQGLSAVVAMQFEITDDAAIIFANEFYGAIADGYPLEAALAEARGAIRDEGNLTEWGTPVMYSRAPDGRLFDLTAPGRISDAESWAQEEAVGKAASRALAPISKAKGRAARDGLPTIVPFLTAAGLEPPEAAAIRARWAAGGRTTQALIGVGAREPFVLDLAQGPHLLVAGTTGSGKSELLQTLVASLAVGNRPDALNFVLIDYKGGAAFRAFGPLPHTVGMLTDLDEFLVERALTSLHAELRRRKAVLSQAGKSDIYRYWDALPHMPGWDPLPRLVIVVDEFAAMAEKLPDQLRSLMAIAPQGRSLGMHLVLATQRPAGIVSNDMRSNINLRIALRVLSAEDSRDIIDTADAALIPAERSGRAYAWLGSGAPVAFQTANVGAIRVPARMAQTGWARPDAGAPTDLSVLVRAIAAAATAERLDHQRSPWQVPLPSIITMHDLGAASPVLGSGALRLPYGLIDQPEAQRLVPAVLDIARGGHLLVAGAPQSGRSTLLRTLGGALAAHISPDEVYLYVIDGGRALAALSALPHCGAVVTADEPDRVDRLLGRLASELTTRTRLLSVGEHGDLAEYRETQPPDDKTPFLLVFVDRYDALVTALEDIDGGRLIQQLQRLMRDGLAVGIRVVVTGDRPVLAGRLASLAENKIILRMADRADYAVAGLNSRTIPADMPNGRGFGIPSADLLQIAVLSEQAQGTTENHALRDLAARSAPPSRPPFRVDALPTAISTEQALALPATVTAP